MEREKGISIDHDCVGSATKRREEVDEEEEEELLGIKLRKGVSSCKSGGILTPIPSWKMEEGGPPNPCSMSKPSARKLGASLWEVQDLLPLSNTSIRRKNEPRQFNNLSDASEPNSPVLASSRNQPITPSSSLNFKGRPGESGYSLKTSAELLKVLNRIWSLEEELASNVTLVRTLKVELHHAHSRIKKLTQEQQTYRPEMDDLMKRVSEDRVTRKNKEHDRIKAAVQSIKNELEDERNLRQQAESLHRKLGKELSEMNSVLNDTLNELENERMLRLLLEDLCDEFAKGLQEYQQEIQDLKPNFGKHGNHRFDQSLHHISKAWMDERFQMKIAESQGKDTEKNRILGRLNGKIAAFFQERRCHKSRNNGAYQNVEKDCSLRRYSVESVHLNGPVSAPHDAEDDDSIISDFHFFELKADAKDNVSESQLKQNDEEGMERRLKGKSRATSRNEKLKCPEKIEGGETCSRKQDRTELRNVNKMHLNDGSRRNSSHSVTEGCRVHPDHDHTDSCNHFLMGGHVTPIGKADASGSGYSDDSQWNHQHASSGLGISKCSSKPLPVKEDSLKEKLLEARLEGKNARLRSLKVSSIGVQ